MSEDSNSPQSSAEEISDKSNGNEVPKNNGKRKFLMIALTSVFVIAGISYGTYWYFIAQFYVNTDDAYVQGNRVILMPRVAGTVVDIRAESTQLVHAGEPLVLLDQTDAQLALQRAEADLANTVREVRQLYDKAAQLESTGQLRRADLAQAKKDLDRDRQLLKIHGISEEKFQHTQTTWETAKASVDEALHQLAAAQAMVVNTTLPEHALVKLSESNVRRAYLDLNRTRVVAPVSGYIAQRGVQVGQKVEPGIPMLSIVPLNQLWVEANLKETQLANVRIGQPVDITADLYGSQITYNGRVIGLSAGTGDAFELLPPQNATGNWIKIVRRVPVRIALDANQLEQYPLRIGLSMAATVDIHNVSGDILAPLSNPDSVYDTLVYQHEMDGVDEKIADIVRQNSNSDTNVNTPLAAAQHPHE